MKVMISLCDLTTAMALPWAEAGYLCYCVDTQHPDTSRQGNIIRVREDVYEWEPFLYEEVAFVSAFPPCTDLAGSGARWWSSKGEGALKEAINLVERCESIAVETGAPWMLENPVGRLSTQWRKWDHIFDPFEYGGYEGGHDDGYTKRTCLWVGGGFIMPEKRPIPLDPLTHDRIHKAAPSPERANLRSATPKGFARAVFEANR